MSVASELVRPKNEWRFSIPDAPVKYVMWVGFKIRVRLVDISGLQVLRNVRIEE